MSKSLKHIYIVITNQIHEWGIQKKSTIYIFNKLIIILKKTTTILICIIDKNVIFQVDEK